MPKPTLVFAALLLALGLGAFALSGSRTALLPAYLGGALAVLAGLALAYAGARRQRRYAGAERRAAGDDDPLVRRRTQVPRRVTRPALLVGSITCERKQVRV